MRRWAHRKKIYYFENMQRKHSDPEVQRKIPKRSLEVVFPKWKDSNNCIKGGGDLYPELKRWSVFGRIFILTLPNKNPTGLWNRFLKDRKIYLKCSRSLRSFLAGWQREKGTRLKELLLLLASLGTFHFYWLIHLLSISDNFQKGMNWISGYIKGYLYVME